MEPTNQGEAEQVAKLSQVIQIDEGKIQEHLGEVVRSTVEQTLNAMLDAEADRLCEAERYERTEARKDTRAGSYQPRSDAIVVRTRVTCYENDKNLYSRTGWPKRQNGSPKHEREFRVIVHR